MSILTIKRRHPRFSKEFKVTFIRKNQKIVAEGVNISKGGLAFEMEEQKVTELGLFLNTILKVRIDSNGQYYLIERIVVKNANESSHEQNKVTLGCEIVSIKGAHKAKHHQLIEGSLKQATSVATASQKPALKESTHSIQANIRRFSLTDQMTWPERNSVLSGDVSHWVLTNKGVCNLDYDEMIWHAANSDECYEAEEITHWADDLRY